MKLFQGFDDLVLSNVASLPAPVLRIFDQGADRKSDIGLDGWKNADDPASPADLAIQPLLAVGRGDPFLVDVREIIEREGVVQTLLLSTHFLINLTAASQSLNTGIPASSSIAHSGS